MKKLITLSLLLVSIYLFAGVESASVKTDAISELTPGAGVTITGAKVITLRTSDLSAIEANSGMMWLRTDASTPTLKVVCAVSPIIYSKTLSDNDSWNDTYTLRTVIPAAQISANGTSIIVTFQASSAGTFTCTHASIVEQSSGADGTAVPTEILFSSSSGFAIANGATIDSDELTYSIDSSKSYLVTMDLSIATVNPSAPARKLSATGWTSYYKAGTAYDQQNFSSGATTQTDIAIGVSKITVGDANGYVVNTITLTP